MELDRVLELAVISSWEELVVPDESCSIHVVYANVSNLALNSVEVWKVKDRGFEGLVCRYSISRTECLAARLHFANSYRSQILADNLDFIMQNQSQFSRPADRSIHGLVQIERPSDEDRKIAISWRDSVRGNVTEMSVKTLRGEANSGSESLFSKEEKSAMSDANQVKPTKEQIQRRAYEMYEAHGRQDGKNFNDWITAEKELIEQSGSVVQKMRTAKAG
jgi:Protein of unknown function (DUF2934)